MELTKIKHKITCELHGCGSVADYTLFYEKKGERNSLHLCSECSCGIYNALKGVVAPAPKGLKNVLNRNDETIKENEVK